MRRCIPEGSGVTRTDWNDQFVSAHPLRIQSAYKRRVATPAQSSAMRAHARRDCMRLVKVRAPEGSDAEVARLAFSVGLSEASVHQEYVHGPDQRKDVI